jgi:ubiquinone/menaquinone biosynthesis C-methylase UbiE
VSAIGQGFTAVDQAPDAERYAEYLRTATALSAIAESKRARDGLLGLRPGAAALDVGCGLGDDARRIAEIVGAGGRVVGVDASAALIERARQPPSGVEWIVADAHDLPFTEGTFDAARTERMLQHVAKPVEIVAEMVRVVRPGAVVLACEPDWSTAAVGCMPALVADALRAAGESVIRHPRIGRDLPAMFVDAGLHDVAVATETVLTRDFALFSAMTDLPAIGARAVGDGLTTQTELDDAVARADRDAAAGRFVAFLSLVTAWGRV